MTSKAKTSFKCQVCEYESIKWQGKCPSCNSWNSFVEIIESIESNSASSGQKLINSKAQLEPSTLAEILQNPAINEENRIYKFSAVALNQFFNQGLVAGGLTLLAGEPGLGKSTLALQLLRALHTGHDQNSVKNGTKNKPKTPLKLLYITAEESQFELARRSQRLHIPTEIMVLQANNFEQIERVLHNTKPHVLILDSIQTVFSSVIPSNPGSVTQVATLASQLLAISKSQNISIIMIGHVTKEGQIAGPKTLEHLVDSVLLLEASESSQYRTLSFTKHRFGTTTSLLLLKMEPTGLEIVTDPSLALLENLETGTGVVYGMALDKDLPLVVEIQALVSKPNFSGGNFFGRREALGIKVTKLNTILAIAEKYLSFDLKNHDIYVQLTGLPKNLSDDSLDLPILLSIISSLQNKSVNQILQGETVNKNSKEGKYIFAGRLTLSGNVRNATNEELRLNTAQKLGFQLNPKIKPGHIGSAIASFSISELANGEHHDM